MVGGVGLAETRSILQGGEYRGRGQRTVITYENFVDNPRDTLLGAVPR